MRSGPARGGLLVLASVIALALAGPAHAAPIAVTTTSDGVDASPANGTCEAPCTLRGAIQTANGAGSPGLDTIALGAQNYLLTTGGGNEDASATGDLDITESLDITGVGVNDASIDGGDLDRVIDVHGGTVNLSGLTIKNGFAAVPPSGFGSGGGLRTNGASIVNVTDAAISDNDVPDNGHGGGAATFDTSTLTLTRALVNSNEASTLPNGGGGGGLSEEEPGSTLRIIDSTVTDNHSQFAAGVWDDGTGTVEITRSTISNNTTVPEAASSPTLQSGGGVVEGAGTVTITDSVITGNSATYGAGVIDEGGTLTITNTAITNNHANAVASSTQPAIQFPHSNGVGGGVLEYGGGVVTITRSTISGNTAAINGAGMVFQGGTNGSPVNITNSTIADNSAGTGGGGIRLDRRNISLTNVTVSGNTAPIGSQLNICQGGPAYPVSFVCAGAITLRNSIVAGSSSANCAKAVGSFTSAGHNLDSGTSCGFNAAGDKKGVNPLLAALASNGGLTRTKALQNGSPAIDAALNCPSTDQRGSPRPFGAGCDMGAFEGGLPAVVSAAAAATPQCGDRVDNDGDGATDLQDPGCKSGGDANEGDENLQDLVLCGRRQISLVRADAKGRRVVLSGLVSQANNGKPIQIFANYGAKKKAKGGRFTRLATVRASSRTGQFTARLKRPSKRLFNKARYFARVGRARSVALKLPQSLASSSVRKVGSSIELRGTVKRSLLGKKRNAIVVRRIVCGRYRNVGSAKPSKRGRYVVRFAAPKIGAAALYRAESRVLARPGSKRYVRAFARALGISLTGG